MYESQTRKQCFVNHSVGNWEIDYILEKVCQDLPIKYEFEGNWYCVLHLPKDEKRTNTNFNQIFEKRLETQENAFRYVYFPHIVKLTAHTFNNNADFSKATFSQYADFMQAKFSLDADFSKATFSQIAFFSDAVFTHRAFFRESIFFQEAAFSGTSFTEIAFFDEAIFSQHAKFRQTTFNSSVDFSKAKFNHEIDFGEATFTDHVYFTEAAFLHDVIFNNITFNEYTDFKRAKFSQYADFRASKFSQYAVFSEATFSQEAAFYEAQFTQAALFIGTTFSQNPDFRKVIFSQKADFSEATFTHDADFRQTTFVRDAFFRSTTFTQDVNFSEAVFEETSQIFFQKTEFNRIVHLNYAVFKGYFTFAGESTKPVFSHKESWLNLQFARLEKPERISFHTVRLHPSWFINVDCRKFVFIDIDWKNADGKRKTVEKEIIGLRKLQMTERPHRLLRITCRQLAQHAEENNRFEEASNFRRMAMETEWLEKKEQLKNGLNVILTKKEKVHNHIGGWTDEVNLPAPTTAFGVIARFDFLHLIYRNTSNYGEGWRLAFILLLGVIAISAILYGQLDFNICPPNESCQIGKLAWFEAVKHSLSTAILQNSEIRKPIGYSELVVTLEKIFAPIQAALLALAIRRKFMR